MRTKHLEAVSHSALCAARAMRGFDLVHFHALGPSLFSWLPRLSGRAVAATVHGLDHARAKWGRAARAALRLGELASARFPHAVIAVSRPLAEHYRAAHGIDATYIPNGAPRAGHRPLDGLRRLGVDEPGYVLFLGRLVPEKGVHTLVEAFRGLDTPRRLVVAGGHGHSAGYERTLRELAGGDPRIVFTGPLFGADKDEVLSNAALFVLPSELEGMPIALLEAASHALALLTSDIPACTGVFGPGGATPPPLATFPVGDAGALARRMEGLLADPGLAASGLAAREAVRRDYDWDDVARRTMAVYGRALAAAGRG